MLAIPTALLDEIRRHAASAYPREACGLLVGTDGDARRVARVHRAENLSASARSDRFEIDPRFYLKTDRAANAEGMRVVGFYHSHPDHPARPSPTDADHAQHWPEFSFVILSVENGQVRDCRSWLFPEAGLAFVEEPIESTTKS